ncbi:MAG TPA: HD domain-containing protein [Chloroflexia bacterium]|nr:HD domain-containing protein [Chloroflexia bacterium]
MNTIVRAIEVAAVAHRDQVRKGTTMPYVTHVYAVGMMLAREGLPEDIVAAGILHDTVEDTPMTLDDIRRDFGERIAAIVEGCTEPDKSASWEERKLHTIEHLRSAPWEVCVVSAADKLHNLHTVVREMEASGESVWARFKRGRAEQAWYYHGLVDSLCGASAPPERPPVPFCEELRETVERLFGPPE